MAIIHFIMGSKGGTGKSMSAALLAAYLQNFKKLTVSCYDTDPQNATLHAYKAFNVKLIKLIDPGTQTINTRFFDTLIEDELFQLESDAHGIIDVGSGSYTGLKAYLLQNTALPLLQSLAKSDIYFHTVLTGGQAYDDSMTCFDELATAFPGIPFVLWLNRYFGKVEKAGQPYNEDERYTKHSHSVHAIVPIPFVNQDTYGADIERLLSQHLTVDAAQGAEGWRIMERQRLLVFQRAVNDALDKARLTIDTL